MILRLPRFVTPDCQGASGLLGRGHVCLNSFPNAINHPPPSPGREMSPAHQYALAGGISFPFFWLAGAGSAVFWVLGEYRVWVAGAGGGLGGQVREQGPELSIFLQEPPSWSLAPTLPSTRLRLWTVKSCRWSQCEASASLPRQLPHPSSPLFCTALLLQPKAPFPSQALGTSFGNKAVVVVIQHLLSQDLLWVCVAGCRDTAEVETDGGLRSGEDSEQEN